MSLVEFRRLADAPPPERELLAIEVDGAAVGWRSTGSSVGRFAGAVGDLEGLRAAAAHAEEGEPPKAAELPADASVERVVLGGRTASVEAGLPVAGPWGPLVDGCRRALDELVASPVAAIAGSVTADGTVRLEHRGRDVLPVELGALRVEVVRWRDGAEAGRAGAGAAGQGRVEAGPGWSLDVAVPGWDASGGGQVVATATFVADDGGVFVPVTITARLAG